MERLLQTSNAGAAIMRLFPNPIPGMVPDVRDRKVNMPVLGFSHYNLRAPRNLLEELKEFYTTVVGLKVGPRPPFRSFGYWLYAQDHDILHLTEAPANELRVLHVATTFDHVAFSCTDLPEMEERLRQHNIKYELGDVPLTGQRQIFFRDPAGNGIELNFPQ